MDFEETVCVTAPINIALVKYWGKEDDEAIIPKNNSISLTLSKHGLKTTTFIRASMFLKENTLKLNNKESKVTIRILRMFKEALKRSTIPENYHDSLKFSIQSTNNFPTAAGMASSASGMAALAYGLGLIFDLSTSDISILARIGSGSATRSVFGGIVEWVKDKNGESVAVQLHDKHYWPQLRVLICEVCDLQKKVLSSTGMQNSVRTSQLYKYRIEHCVQENLEEMREALQTKNFSKLASVTMRESNQLHAICLDTVPPIVYLNAGSFLIIEFVGIVNEISANLRLAYTFDAGPNAFLICEEQSLPLVRYLLAVSFGLSNDFSETTAKEFGITEATLQAFMSRLPRYPSVIRSITACQLSSGPQQCSSFL